MTNNKNNKKINNNKSKQKKKVTVVVTRNVPKAMPKTVSRPRVSMHAMQQVCSTNDPFCPSAIGAKYVDQSSVRSFAITSHSRLTMSTTAAGDASTAFLPSYFFMPTTIATTLSGGVATFSNVLIGSSLPSATAVRLVSWGLIVRSIVAPLSASGMVRIRTFSDRTFATLGTGVDVMTYNCDAYEDTPINNCRELAVIGKRTDPSCKNWRLVADINTSNLPSGWVSPGFASVIVSVTGAPASVPVLDVEFMFNWEIMLEDNNPLSQMSTKAPPFSLAIDTASNIVSSTSQSIFKSGVSAVGKYIERKAIMALSSYLGPLGVAASLALTVD